MSELSEEEILNIYGFLKKHADKLPSGEQTDIRAAVRDRNKIEELMRYMEGRLKEIAWEKYRRTQGLSPPPLEEKVGEASKEA